MQRWIQVIERLSIGIDDGDGDGDGGEEFGMDWHDLSLENVFVDEDDHSKNRTSREFAEFNYSSNINSSQTCIIDWESTTIRPLRPTFPRSSSPVPSHQICSETS
jgi:hypothetical protein